MTPDLLKALQGVCYIAQHIKDADKDKEVNLMGYNIIHKALKTTVIELKIHFIMYSNGLLISLHSCCLKFV